jgi:eukaryotic-like serine/threonine-protein kinase
MRVELAVTEGPMKGKVFSFSEPDRFLFGRAENAKCALSDDPYVSGHHFLLGIAPPTVSLHELDSKNGTFVNDVRYGGRKPPTDGTRVAPEGVIEVELASGDRIAVGSTVLEISILPDTACLECDALLPIELAEALRKEGSPFLCDPCSQKKGLTPGGTMTYSPAPAPAPPKAKCKRCQTEISGASSDDAICSACLREKALEPLALLKTLLEAAQHQRAKVQGPQIPDYELLSLLGEGGMGKVFKARDKKTGRLVAIKVILPKAAVDSRSIALFERETDLTRQLDHPNIVKCFDGGCTNGVFFLVLEFVDGLDLCELRRQHKGGMPLTIAGPIMVDALRGLGYAHRAALEAVVENPKTGRLERKRFEGLVHRDLKPPNILLEKLPGGGYQPRIADLGLAKVYGAAGNTNMTGDQDIAGTPIYWPREQITNYRYLKPASDVFSMGSVLYQLLTGRLPRAKLNGLRPPNFFNKLCVVILKQPIEPIRRHLPNLNRAVAAVIDKSLEDRPAARFADGVEMADALEQALGEAGVPVRRR